MDSLQGAFMHPPEPCEARFIVDARTLFHVFRTGSRKHLFSPMERLGGTRIFFLYNSDWIRLKEESHIHLGCFESE